MLLSQERLVTLLGSPVAERDSSTRILVSNNKQQGNLEDQTYN
jgi:hypothetical protein